MERSLESKPRVCFEVEKVIGVSLDGNVRTYQVQWAPAWVSSFHLVGCEHLIQEFLQQSTVKDSETNASSVLKELNTAASLQQLDVDSVDNTEINYILCEPSGDAAPFESNDSGEDVLSSSVRVLADCIDVKMEEDNDKMDSTNYEILSAFCRSENSSEDISVEQDLFTGNKKTVEVPVSESTIDPSSSLFDTMNYEQPDAVRASSSLACMKKCVYRINNDASHPWNVNPTTYNTHESCKTNTDQKTHLKYSVVNRDENQESFRDYSEDTLYYRGDNGKLHCRACNIVTGTKQKMEEHIRVHTGHRPFQCEVCDKQFKRKQDLKRHTNIHSGVKPHICPGCKRGFTDRSNLNQHVKLCIGLKNET